MEWGTRGITVNAVGSGWQQDSPFLPAADDEQQRLLRYIPDHRLGQPDDLAALTVYLASDGGGEYHRAGYVYRRGRHVASLGQKANVGEGGHYYAG